MHKSNAGALFRLNNVMEIFKVEIRFHVWICAFERNALRLMFLQEEKDCVILNEILFFLVEF